MIPVILLGDPKETKLCAALRVLLRHRCGWCAAGDFFWSGQADILLVDRPAPFHLDAGGGLVILKESFCKQDSPAHLLHAQCIFSCGHPPAQELVARCGLPALCCGGQGDLILSSAQEQTVLTLQRQLVRLDGEEIPAGDLITVLPESLSPCEQLLCAATLLLLGEKLPEAIQ